MSWINFRDALWKCHSLEQQRPLCFLLLQFQPFTCSTAADSCTAAQVVHQSLWFLIFLFSLCSAQKAAVRLGCSYLPAEEGKLSVWVDWLLCFQPAEDVTGCWSSTSSGCLWQREVMQRSNVYWQTTGSNMDQSWVGTIKTSHATQTGLWKHFCRFSAGLKMSLVFFFKSNSYIKLFSDGFNYSFDSLCS